MLSWRYPRVIAHRGGGTLAPENTLAALAVAVRHGCRAVELDARLSADGTPFLIHDATLDRTTSGTGRVARTRDSMLRLLDAGCRHGAAFAGEPLPTLQEAIQRCVELGVWANIEIKAEAGAEAACGSAVAHVVSAAWRGTVPLLSSFSTTALEAAQRAAPDLPRALLVRRLARGWRASAGRLGCVGVHSEVAGTTRDQVAAVHEAGFVLACYTVNERESVRQLFAAGVDAVFTDRPDRIHADACAV